MERLSKETSRYAKQHQILFLEGKLLKVLDNFPKSYQLVFKFNNIVTFAKKRIPASPIYINLYYDSEIDDEPLKIWLSQKYAPSLSVQDANDKRHLIMINLVHPRGPRKSSKRAYSHLEHVHLTVGNEYDIKGYGIPIYNLVTKNHKKILQASNHYDMCDDTFGIWENEDDTNKLSRKAQYDLTHHHDKLVWLIKRLSKMRDTVRNDVKRHHLYQARTYTARYAKIICGYAENFTPATFNYPLRNMEWIGILDQFSPIQNSTSASHLYTQITGKPCTAKQAYYGGSLYKTISRLAVNWASQSSATVITPNSFLNHVNKWIKQLKEHKFN